MVRLSLTLLLGTVLVVGVGQGALAVDGPSYDQPAPADQSTVVRPAPVDRSTVVVEPAPADRSTVVVEPVAPGQRVVVRTEATEVYHVSDVSKLPSGAVGAVGTAVPGGTIVEVDKVPLRNAWNVHVVDPQGRLHNVRVDKEGQVVSTKDLRAQNERIADLPENVRSAVQQRYPDAVIYNVEDTVENGKKAYEVEILNRGQRVDVKSHHRTGEILEVETDADDVAHDPNP